MSAKSEVSEREQLTRDCCPRTAKHGSLARAGLPGIPRCDKE